MPEIRDVHMTQQLYVLFEAYNYFRIESTYKIVSMENIYFHENQMSLVVRIRVFGVSDQVRHKPGCVATEDG